MREKSNKRTDAQRAKHAAYMRKYNVRKRDRGYHKTQFDSPDNKLMYTGMKYSHLIDEPVNNGRDYKDYKCKKKVSSERKAFLKRIEVDRKERIRKFGELNVPKITHRMWGALKGNFYL